MESNSLRRKAAADEYSNELKSQRLDDGLDGLRSYLDARIHLPVDKDQWPSPELIGMANKLRRY